MDEGTSLPALIRSLVPYSASDDSPCAPEAATESGLDSLKRMIRVVAGAERIGYDQLVAAMEEHVASINYPLIAVVAAKNGRIEDAVERYPRLLAMCAHVLGEFMQSYPQLVALLDEYLRTQQRSPSVATTPELPAPDLE